MQGAAALGAARAGLAAGGRAHDRDAAAARLPARRAGGHARADRGRRARELLGSPHPRSWRGASDRHGHRAAPPPVAAGVPGRGGAAFPRAALDAQAVAAIHGHGRVEEVDLLDLDSGRTRALGCDTVVFTADWVPDHELAVMAGLELDPVTPRAGSRRRAAHIARRRVRRGQRAARSRDRRRGRAERPARGRYRRRLPAPWRRAGRPPRGGLARRAGADPASSRLAGSPPTS